MSLAEVLNLSKPRLALFGVVASAGLVALTLNLLRYNPPVWDSCEGVTKPAALADSRFDLAMQHYLRQTRNLEEGEYCVLSITDEENERIVSLAFSGKRVGGGFNFQLRIDPTDMTVLGEGARD